MADEKPAVKAPAPAPAASAAPAPLPNPVDTAIKNGTDAQTKAKGAADFDALKKTLSEAQEYLASALKAQTDNPSAQADAAVAAAQGKVAAAQKAVGGVAESAQQAGADAAKTAGGFLDKFKGITTGSVLGGLLAGVGAWLLGGFFGEGIMGTILSIGLGILLLPMGMKFGSETIDGWLGNKKDGQQTAQGQGQQLRRDGQTTQGQGQGQMNGLLTQPDLANLVAEATSKGRSTSQFKMMRYDDGHVDMGTIAQGEKVPAAAVITRQELQNLIDQTGAAVLRPTGTGQYTLAGMPSAPSAGRNR